MGLDKVHAFLQGVGEGLDNLRILLEVALFGRKGSVRDIAGILAQRGHHMAVALGFQRSRMGFKFDCVSFLLRQI